jgi:succinate-semialdehyde dehydrogenase/glutarate-semialdehyde dehydrogenase
MSLTNLGSELLSYGNYVAGKDVESGKWVHVLSPRVVLDDSFSALRLKRELDRGTLSVADTEAGLVVGRVALADDRIVSDALASAAAAAVEWRTYPRSVRFDHTLERIHDRLVEYRDLIIEMLTYEGHPLELAKWEYSGCLQNTSKLSRDFLRAQMWSEHVTEDGRRRIVRRQPDGVVCVNPPANAPTASALLAALCIASGNAVVVRAPRTAPLGVMCVMRELIVDILEEVGAPAGTLNVLCGNPAPLLKAWLESPHVDDIMYFGSVEPGLKFEQKCVAAGKKPILELAGNDIVTVWSDANVDHAASAIAESFYGSGQLCMVPNLVVAHPDIADELIARVAEKAESIKPGYPDDEGALLSPVLRHDGFNAFIADAIGKGAKLVTGGAGMHLDGTTGDTGFFLQPTVVRVDGLDRAREIDAVREETFFPLIPIVVAEKADDEGALLSKMIAFVNSNRYGLRNSLWARDETVVDRYVTAVVNAGLLKVNESHIAFSAPLPSHGGTGVTGGVFGEANYPILRTTHLQGVAISDGTRPPRHR